MPLLINLEILIHTHIKTNTHTSVIKYNICIGINYADYKTSKQDEQWIFHTAKGSYNK